MSWEQAGQAWGHRARDWAYLLEPHGHRAYERVLAEVSVGHGTRLLDVACGSGFACMLAAEERAQVAGLDASEELLAVARERVPDGDFRCGDMEALPWEDATFDVVTSFQGVFFGGDRTVGEMARTLKIGGRCAILFWGRPDKAQHLSYVAAASALAPPELTAGAADLLRISEPGVAEKMLEAAGLEVTGRASLEATSEWPDDEIAWRAGASTGVAYAAIAHSGEEAVRDAVLAALAPFKSLTGGYRLRSTFDYVTARKLST